MLFEDFIAQKKLQSEMTIKIVYVFKVCLEDRRKKSKKALIIKK